ncbi:uncharacterized protein BO88DRAFT_83118 [Aspergillus vadensis CBS 113365]|uniref:Uncharacterized protein n=1 Tax=Aspergillus vadensis (strain CBS 113365 / IMI 142717 / IBT 24658) TaxID=1448311 RepID=A0A319B579_ASPVC|nr:hypothetical protein BO88DRAFT_83118 [Aspergillus vadensis CBS 113365]PYH67041.1 hypothetical protein BO88DRAFT_83118 [Aspergillus vadensis CBS 113365]
MPSLQIMRQVIRAENGRSAPDGPRRALVICGRLEVYAVWIISSRCKACSVVIPFRPPECCVGIRPCISLRG